MYNSILKAVNSNEVLLLLMPLHFDIKIRFKWYITIIDIYGAPCIFVIPVFLSGFFFLLKHGWPPSSVHVAANDRISFYGQILFTRVCASHFSLRSSFPHRQLLHLSSVITTAQTSLQHFQHWFLFPLNVYPELV